MKKILCVILLMVGFSILASVPALVKNGSVAAVDIFSRCQNDSDVQDKSVCADCASTAKETDVCKTVGAQGANDGTNNPIVKIIKAAISILSYIVGAAAAIGVVISGIRLVTAGGDSSATASARTGLIYSLIGIAVVASAQLIVIFVLGKIQ